MIEVEEVYLDESEQYEQSEFFATEDERKPSPVRRIKIATRPTQTTVKRKIPIVRLAGEVVTPVQLRSVSGVPVSNTLKPASKTNSKIDWSPRVPLQIKTTLKRPLKPTPSPLKSKVKRQSDDDQSAGDSNDEGEFFNRAVENAPGSSSSFSQDRLSRIESKLDTILSKLSQHDAALKLLKFNIKDLRIELKNNNKHVAEMKTFEQHRTPAKRERKRIVLFPVADDNYLYRLEELSQTDDDIRSEVIMLFNDAPTTSVYDYLRRNIAQLLENCSKHTWTGKASNNANADQTPSCAAGKLSLIETLISCCCDQFVTSTRDFIEKEFRRALTNFNEARHCRLLRRMQKESCAGAAADDTINGD